MIRRVWRKLLRFLGSPRLALVLLLFVGAWCVLATTVPQGDAEWAGRTGAMASLVRAVHFQQAFSSPVFVACVILLTLSTAVCSWNRTKVALSRSRSLKAAAEASAASVLQRGHDLEGACLEPSGDAETLAITSETLRRLGVKTEIRDGVVRSVSRRWSVWGSPIFHWSLLALILAAFVGTLVRYEGVMAVPVGATLTDTKSSYLSTDRGLLSGLRRFNRSVRVDAFEPDYTVGGIDRGAVPTVSVLDRGGNVIVKQRVYMNKKLHAGSLSISAPDVGLAANVALINPSGQVVSVTNQLVQFSQEASGGTVPVQELVRSDAGGNVFLRMRATVPLERSGKGYGEWVPRPPVARVYVTSGNGVVMLDRVLHEGETAPLLGGGAVKLIKVGWYSRLSLVDDPTIPIIYASFLVAALGLALSVAAPQRLVLATIWDGPEGRKLVMSLRLWRNNPTSRAEIERELTRALQAKDRDSEGSTS